MLRLTGLHQRYGAREVLTLRHFEAAAGDHWLLLGASGSGKTTLLNLLAGLLRPTEGTVEIGGQVLGALSAQGGAALDRWRGRNIGIVPQKLHLVSSLNVLQNLLLAPYLAGLPVDESRALDLLRNLSLVEKAKEYPRHLSHGQAQRVAIARAVMNRPKLLLADEPTSNLDDVNCGLALSMLEEQARECGALLVVATHDMRARARFEKCIEL